MEFQSDVKNLDAYIIRAAYLYSTLLVILLWFAEGGNTFNFLWSGDLIIMAFFVNLSAALMIGTYYGLQRFRLEPLVQLCLGLLLGGVPTMALTYLSL